MNRTKAGEKLSCFLCGLDSEYLPSISGEALVGISCRRCGDYYLDDLLVNCGMTEEEADRAILSGYTRWQPILKNPIPKITVDKEDAIIRNNKNYSDSDKVDKLLIYYSNEYPNKGSNIEFIANLDYPITFSPNSVEFVYLLEKVASESDGYLDIILMASPPQGYFQITPKGWARIDELKKGKSAGARHDIQPEIDIAELLNQEESITLEFKSTFEWDIEQKRVNKELRREVIEILAAFNNTKGGYLLIGVSDDKKVLGLEKDFTLIRHSNKEDFFLQKLCSVIGDATNSAFPVSLLIQFPKMEDKYVCKIKVNFGDEPVFVKENNNEEAFYIRVHNSNKKLSVREALSYIKANWKHN